MVAEYTYAGQKQFGTVAAAISPAPVGMIPSKRPVSFCRQMLERLWSLMSPNMRLVEEPSRALPFLVVNNWHISENTRRNKTLRGDNERSRNVFRADPWRSVWRDQAVVDVQTSFPAVFDYL